jgi:multiple sugar transport system substrate-binding protein
MTDNTRRQILKAFGAAAVAATIPPAAAQPAPLKYTPEVGAKLKLMRWRRFIQGDEDQWNANTAAFTKLTGVEVTISNEGFEDVRPKLALAANVGSGPDLALGWMEDPHFFPDKLVELTDLAEYLGKKYGGWYDTARRYGTINSGPNKGKWIGLPLGAGGAMLNYRISWMKEAGFETFPTDFPSYLKMCQKLSKNGHPPGFALSHATGDAETWSHNVLWGFGGKVVDEKNNVVINSPETVAAIEYMIELNKTFIDGTLSWTGVSNNNAFLEGRISLTSNGPSIYYVAKNSTDPKQKAIAADMNHAAYPIGPSGQVAELHLLSQAMVFKYTKYPNAAKAYLQFMWEKEQYEPWQAAATSYMCPPLKAYAQTPFWKSDPKYAPFRDATARMRWSGYAGDIGEASAACLADWVVVDMFAQAVSGQKSPKDAAREAEKRAKRHYRA